MAMYEEELVQPLRQELTRLEVTEIKLLSRKPAGAAAKKKEDESDGS